MRRWLLTSVGLAALGCVSTHVQHFDQVIRPARSPDSVNVLLEEPDQPYTVIAVIESRGESVFDSFGHMRDAMVAEAAQLGGDALLLAQQVTDETFILAGTALIKSDRKRLTGKVIVFGQAPSG